MLVLESHLLRFLVSRLGDLSLGIEGKELEQTVLDDVGPKVLH